MVPPVEHCSIGCSAEDDFFYIFSAFNLASQESKLKVEGQNNQILDVGNPCVIKTENVTMNTNRTTTLKQIAEACGAYA